MLMSDRSRSLGLTLTSIMVAVALSGVLAVAAVRLAVNQMNSLQTVELIDKGDAIFKFYSNLLHDDKVWFCTLYDGIEEKFLQNTTPLTNQELHDCVLAAKGGVACPGIGVSSAVALKGSDCRWNEQLETKVTHDRSQPVHTHVTVGRNYRKFRRALRAGGILDFSYRGNRLGIKGPKDKNFQSSSVVFIPKAGKDLRESLIQSSPGGWWNVKLEWEHMGNRAVDLVFTQTFDRDKWRSVTAPKRELPQLREERVLRVRRSANYIPNSCGGNAVTRIALHTTNRAADCGEKLVSGDCRYQGAVNSSDCSSVVGGVIRHTDFACSTVTNDRVSVTPIDCGAQSSVLARIGHTGGCEGRGSDVCLPHSYGGLAPWRNTECALGGAGKLVTPGSCGGTTDWCEVRYGVDNHIFVNTPRSNVVRQISGGGGLTCGTLMGWPAGPGRNKQGAIGGTGAHGGGPPGPPGPTGPAWNAP